MTRLARWSGRRPRKGSASPLPPSPRHPHHQVSTSTRQVVILQPPREAHVSTDLRAGVLDLHPLVIMRRPIAVVVPYVAIASPMDVVSDCVVALMTQVGFWRAMEPLVANLVSTALTTAAARPSASPLRTPMRPPQSRGRHRPSPQGSATPGSRCAPEPPAYEGMANVVLDLPPRPPSELVAGGRAPDQPPNQPTAAECEWREHVLAAVTTDLGLGGGPIVRVLLRETPHPCGHLISLPSGAYYLSAVRVVPVRNGREGGERHCRTELLPAAVPLPYGRLEERICWKCG